MLVVVNAAEVTLKFLCKCFENVSSESAECLFFIIIFVSEIMGFHCSMSTSGTCT